MTVKNRAKITLYFDTDATEYQLMDVEMLLRDKLKTLTNHPSIEEPIVIENIASDLNPNYIRQLCACTARESCSVCSS